jgi:VWFA-related protein
MDSVASALKPDAAQRLIALIATLAAASGVLLGRQAPPQQTPPTFRGSVEAVQLTVIVTDSQGTPVSGLTEDDFEIIENRVPRPITTFAAVDIPIEQGRRPTPAPLTSDVLTNDRPQGRLYVIALDVMLPQNALRTRAFLRQFIEKHFGPNDTAAVFAMARGLRDSGQEFTSNPRLLLQAIDTFGGSFADEWSAREREKNFIGDFKSLMQFMASLRGGRKALILFSENVPVDAYAVVQARPSQLTGLFSDFDTDFVEALSLATRNSIAIYPIDPKGLTTDLAAPESFDTSALTARADLGSLAAVTGGFALSGSNNYTMAFERLVRENSSYYLLGFNSGVEQRDGRFVGVEVRVKRPGLVARSVQGYVSPRGRPPQERRPSTVLAATWDAVASGITTSGLPMRVYAAPFKSRGKDATVAITVEVAGSRLNLVQRDGAYRGVFEVIFAVTDVKKKRWPIWRHRAELALKPETYERVSRGAMRVISQMSLPEGRYQLRASAGGAAVAGSVVYDLVVPDFREDFSLSGVALTSRQASETFTFTPHKQIDVGLPGPPTTAREFSREDTLTLFTEAYENRRKPHTVTLTMELRDGTGRVLGSHAIERKSAGKPTGPSAYAFAPNLSLEAVPPGRYALRVSAGSSLGKETVVREVPFTVR